MNDNTYMGGDEITLKELILKLGEFFEELRRSWLLICVITLPFIVWLFYDAFKTPVKYKADLVFMINEEKGGGGGGISAIASQFGLNVGGGGGGEYNKDKIIFLSKRGIIIHPVILDSLKVEGKNDLIGNHLIRLYGLHEKWGKGKNEKLKNFLFKRNSIDDLDITGNAALKACYSLIIGTKEKEGLSTCDYEKDSGILSIRTQSFSEELALGLTENIFKNLSTFYIKQQIEPQQKSYESIKAKADSINTLIRNKEYELANLKDGNNNIFLRKYKLQENRLQRELPAYASQYATLLQNVENADFLLKNRTPFFQVVDYPFFPLSQINTSIAKAIISGGLIGGFVALLFVILRKIYRETMSEN